MFDQQNPSFRAPLGLFVDLSNAISRDKERFVEVIKATGKGIDEGTRKASAHVKAALLATPRAFITELDNGEQTLVAFGDPDKGAVVGFKFSTFDDGSFAFETFGGGADLPTMAAVFDVIAAALAEMDSHSMQNDWAATPSPAFTTSTIN